MIDHTPPTKDIWDFPGWKVIPTNLQTRRDGTAVMGAGLAKQAALQYPDLPRLYGEQLRGLTDQIPDLPMVCQSQQLILFPTKDHWRDNSDLELIDYGLAWLRDPMGIWQSQGGLYIPKLGCGLGRLSWRDQVRPLVEHYLGDLEGIYYPD